MEGGAGGTNSQLKLMAQEGGGALANCEEAPREFITISPLKLELVYFESCTVVLKPAADACHLLKLHLETGS